ncbi:MAG: mandelate racemase/muconate lactonizing enzyme family protein [Dehalococcoidia bacterium]|jgi:galactonate dehydratase|nr:mandelate racemase/muconate lactonizing enzyme family protein [Dehalococcoidia bacterium]
MKVTQIRSYSIKGETGRGYFIVRVDTDAGHYGLGEIGMRGRGLAITRAIEHLSELVIGADPWETERLWQEMFRSGFFPADTVYSCAISAIDIALWDIKGKSVDMPVYKLLGGPVRNKVLCYPHAQGMNIPDLVESAKKHVDEGWKFLRWHQLETSEFGPDGSAEFDPLKSVRISIDSFAAVREAVGWETQLCFDVHTRLDPAMTIQMCRELEEFKPFFIEDPARSENPGTYRNLRNKINLPIAAGEQWGSKWLFRQVIEEDLIDYARIDLCIVGGITEALKITHWAEAHYIDIVPHNPLGPVSAAACVALCMASTNVGVQEMPRQPGTTDNTLFPRQIEWAEGYSWCADVPGLGVDFDIEAAEAAYENPAGRGIRFRRPDGAFTNW